MCVTCGSSQAIIERHALERGRKPGAQIQYRARTGNGYIYAQKNRDYLSGHGIFALNPVSCPGSGKATLPNKCDLLPYLTFDADIAAENARRANPGIQVIRVSAGSGDEMDAWLEWIKAGDRGICNCLGWRINSYSLASSSSSPPCSKGKAKIVSFVA